MRRSSPPTFFSRVFPVFLLTTAVFLVAGILTLASQRILPTTPTLSVWFFDVGQGDATFLSLPDRTQILVDGGPDRDVLAKLGSVMWPWDRTIDAVELTHPHADHVAGLHAVLERYRVDKVYESGASASTDWMEAWEERIRAEGAVHRFVKSGDILYEDGKARLTVLSPPQTMQGSRPHDPNETSVVLLLTFGEMSVLLTGDATDDQERVFDELAGDIDVLKVGHHGSATSSAPDTLDVLQPEVAVISVGEGNRYGHPHPAVEERLRRAGIRVYRTDWDGDLLLTSTGGEPLVRPAPLPF